MTSAQGLSISSLRLVGGVMDDGWMDGRMRGEVLQG